MEYWIDGLTLPWLAREKPVASLRRRGRSAPTRTNRNWSNGLVEWRIGGVIQRGSNIGDRLRSAESGESATELTESPSPGSSLAGERGNIF